MRQWEYTPTVIDGRAVPVIMTVTANFAVPDLASPPPSAPRAAPSAPSAGALDADLEAALQYLQRRQYDERGPQAL